MTPNLFKKYVQAEQTRLERETRIQDMNNHILGIYIRRAVGDVLSGKNKYPRRPFLEKKQTNLKRALSKEETEAFIAKIGKGIPDDAES